MKEYGVVNGRETDWLWAFDGTAEDCERFERALMAAEVAIEDDTDGDS